MLLYYIKAFFRAVADFFASMGAKYAAYLERENAKARAEAKANAVMLAEQNMLGDYLTVAEIVARAVNNMAEADPNLIRRVTDISQITNPRAAIANRTLNGRAVFFWCFRLRLSRGCSCPAAAVRRILQAEIDAVTAAYGFPSLRVDVRFRADNIAAVIVAPQASLIGGANNARP